VELEKKIMCSSGLILGLTFIFLILLKDIDMSVNILYFAYASNLLYGRKIVFENMVDCNLLGCVGYDTLYNVCMTSLIVIYFLLSLGWFFYIDELLGRLKCRKQAKK